MMRFPRDLALKVLARVMADHEALDRVLDTYGAEAAESRGWLQEVCSGTLRWKGRLELAIDSAALKKKPSGWLRRALLLAAYQLVVQEQVVKAAVVSEAVDQVKKKDGEAPGRFANALLRKIADHAAEWRELPFPKGAPAAQCAAWASLPLWMWERMVRDHGVEWAQAYATASLVRPQLWLKARKEGWTLPWLEAGPVRGSFRQISEATPGGLITQWPGFLEGSFIVQDISSQTLVAEVVEQVRAVNSAAAPVAIDWCAAPGGKSAGLSWAGFRVIASDLDPERLPLLRQTVQRAAREVEVVPYAELAKVPAADLVWVDAPCTGSGILRRHPDARWLKRETDLEGLNRAQDEVLRLGWERVKPGGFLAYSVCSVFKAEGTERVQRMVGPTAQLKKEWFFTPQIAPFGDGFYAALLRKS